MIIDTHAHLDHLEHLDEALKNAKQAGVEAIVAVGVDLTANKKNLETKSRVSEPKIHVALGLHPGNIKIEEVDATISFIRENIKQAVAIGEIGLDYWYPQVKKDPVKKQEQNSVFEKMLGLAAQYNLPAIIHSRGAWQECLDMTLAAGVKKAVFHWYSGPVSVQEEIIRHGYYVSTSPSVAYSPQSREAMSAAPLERTLIETDCPVRYRPGPDDAGFIAEPRDVFRTLKAYAELKGIEEAVALKALNNNARQLFGI